MRQRKYLVSLALGFLPTLVFASEGASLNDLLSLAPGSMLWTILTFFLLLFILWKFAWGPILSGLEAREDKIKTAIEQAQRDREEAAKQLREYEEKLKTATSEISERLAKADKDAESRIDKARDEARAEGQKMLDHARAEIEAAKERVKSELRQEVGNLAAEIAARAIGESFSRDDQMRIINKRLKSLETKS